MQDLDEHHGLSFFRGSFEGLGLWEPLLLSPGPSVSDCFLEIDLAMVPASRCCAVSAPGAHDRTPSFFYSRSDGSTDDSGLGAGAFSIRIHICMHMVAHVAVAPGAVAAVMINRESRATSSGARVSRLEIA